MTPGLTEHLAGPLQSWKKAGEEVYFAVGGVEQCRKEACPPLRGWEALPVGFQALGLCPREQIQHGSG